MAGVTALLTPKHSEKYVTRFERIVDNNLSIQEKNERRGQEAAAKILTSYDPY